MSSQQSVIVSFSDKVTDLRRCVRQCESAVVAFSGGVDSGVLAAIACDELKEKMVAVLGVSPAVPRRDRDFAASFCQQHRIPFRERATDEFSEVNYVSNPSDRCYYCKRELYHALSELTHELQYACILDGTNASDLHGHRPGFRAVRENIRVVTPLVDANFSKDDVRRLAREMNLDIAEKPATACLASRVPTGVPVDAELLGRIDRAEDRLRDLGFFQVRVRHHGELARIEVATEELPRALEVVTRMQRELSQLGWKFVTLDLAGYRPGGASS